MTFLVAALGGLVGLGVWVILMTLDGQQILPERSQAVTVTADRSDPELVRRVVAAVVAAVVLGVLTWPVMGLIFGIGTVLFWNSVGSRKQATVDAERADGIAIWAEQVYSSLRAGSGTTSSIRGAALHAHPSIEQPARQLAVQIENVPLHVAIRQFADAIGSPEADSMAMAITITDLHGSRRLTDVLKVQAERTRLAAKDRLEISASRQQTRTAIRVILAIAVITMVTFRFFGGKMSGYYATSSGQLVLVISGLIFLAGFALLAKLAGGRPRRRYFSSEEST